jgi:hypothetical protein
MARRYLSIGSDAAAVDTSLLALISAATIRPVIYELGFGSSATPADNAFLMKLQRFTVAGTATSVTPQKMDPPDPASLASAGKAHSAEPTYTSGEVVLQFAINQQATYRWVVPPDRGIVLPATAANGAGLWWGTVSGGTATCDANIYHEE